jgi:hypothetical protein
MLLFYSYSVSDTSGPGADGGIGDAGSTSLGRMLRRNKSLRVIDVDNNEIGPDGVEALSDTLRENETVTSLSLAGEWRRRQLRAGHCARQALSHCDSDCHWFSCYSNTT